MTQILLPLILGLTQAVLVFLCIVVIILCFILLIAWAMLYEKMGLKGWMSLVPYYNSYVLFKKVWKVKPFWAYLALSLALIILEILEGCFNDPNLMPLYVIMFLAVAIACLVVRFKLMSALSASFGHSFLFALGLTLLPIIFVPILAFGKSEYIGPQQIE